MNPSTIKYSAWSTYYPVNSQIDLGLLLMFPARELVLSGEGFYVPYLLTNIV